MTESKTSEERKVLIVSSHPLFGKGIRRMLESRKEGDVKVVGIVSTVEEAKEALARLEPDLVVVDFDDDEVNRDEFMAHFVEGRTKMRAVLFSLQDGGNSATVYDRRTLEASQVDDWLNDWVSQEAETDLDFTLENGGLDDKPNKKNTVRSSSMKHVIGVILFVAVLAVGGMMLLTSDNLLPEQASVQAERIDWLFDVQFKIIAFLFALIVGVMLYSVIFFRRKPGDDGDGAFIKENSALEYTWTVIPLIIVLSLSFVGADVLADTMRMDPKALEVKVIGQQWSWRFEYPDQAITSTDLVLPVNKQVYLRLTSEDVIHSFWVPEFRLKQDALPGSFQELRVTPKNLGEYQMVCSEMCGQQHAYMTAPVKVVSQEEFDTWVSESQIPADPIGRGEYWYRTQGCAACHSLDGSKIVGPTFLGLLGRTENFIDGTSLIADEDYIIESIFDPYSKIVDGFELSPGSGTSAMPANYTEKLNEEQILDIIEFIKSLE